MDIEAICDALAARYTPGTIGTPTGVPAMRAAYGQMPHSMPNTPAVVVMPQDGDVVAESGSWVLTNNIDVNFYLSKAPGDIERVETYRQKWLQTLLEAVLGSLTLGSIVKSAFPIGWEFTELPYGGDQYDAIVIHYQVIVREAVTFTP